MPKAKPAAKTVKPAAKKVVKAGKKVSAKPAARSKPAPGKATARLPVSTRTAARKASAPKATPATSASARPAPAKATSPPKAVVPPPAPTKPEVSLGRPLVTQEEKLYMLFHDDYQARQVFEFLRVDTVKELEQFSQQQIVHMMSKPLRMTVDRIRQRLAQFKRSLKDDESFAAQFQRDSASK